MNKVDLLMAGAIIAIMLGLLFYSTNARADDISCRLFKSIDFILTDKQVDARISNNIIDRMGDSSISRCVASRSRDVLRRGARRFCRKKGNSKTPDGLTLDGFFWSTGELLKLQCTDDAAALINWDWVGNEEG